jgi:hypothetical protein
MSPLPIHAQAAVRFVRQWLDIHFEQARPKSNERSSQSREKNRLGV